MRKSLVAVAALTTVASGCGEYNFTPVPTCKANEFLTGDGKALKCVEVKVENPTPMVQDMAMPPPAAHGPGDDGPATADQGPELSQ